MVEYDLTAKLARYPDRHLVFRLFEFLSERNVGKNIPIRTAEKDTC